jgi:transposase InsO family protein
VTPAEIIYQRRIAVLDHAQRTGNVSEACRVFGISRTRYYEWKNVADRYGLDALMPKGRRKPQMPEATPTHVIEALLTLAVLQPTIGCRQYADRLGDQGFSIAKSTVQNHLVANGLGKRSERLAKAAAIAAATTGLVVPDAERKDEPFGFCLATGGPGELVCLDSFYIGKLKGVGKVYQLTAIDVFTRFAITSIVLGTPDGAMTARFIAQALRLYRRHGVRVKAMLTDNGPEYIAGTFVQALAAKGLRHVRIPARSPNHNAVCERFQGTMLQEC